MSSVPRNKLWIVFDHGVAELPEWRHEQRSLKCPEPSGRINLAGRSYLLGDL